MGAPLLCSRPECGRTQPCPEHARPAWGGAARPSWRTRGYSVDHEKHRQELWRNGPPPCECTDRTCGCLGDCNSLADVLDHTTPLSECGQDVRSNRRPLCDACHDLKTSRESQRGRARRRLA